MYKHTSPHEMIIRNIQDRLLKNGFKVLSMHDINDEELILKEKMKQQIELVKQSKVILFCLETVTQTDKECQFILKRDQLALKRPRPVIPLFLEPRTKSFPDNEIKVHCYMGRSDTKIFDVSSFNTNMSSTNSEHVEILIEDTYVYESAKNVGCSKN